MRYCTSDAWFQLKEVEIGIAADVGVLQRMPKIVANDRLGLTEKSLLENVIS